MLLTKNELQKKLNVSLMTINRLMAKGMPYIKIEKSVRFDEEQVMAWIEEKYNKRD